jgi:hypothetical protein
MAYNRANIVTGPWAKESELNTGKWPVVKEVFKGAGRIKNIAAS